MADGKSNNSDLSNVDLAMTGSPRPLSTFQNHSRASIFSDEMEVDSPVPHARPTDHEQCAWIDNAEKDTSSVMAPANATKVRDLTQEQEGTLVRSALRSSLDGEDAVLLNDFLSKAQAKRAAKAASVDVQGAVVGDSSSPDESPDTECATPRSRRALEALDTNSPSPTKPQTSLSVTDSPSGHKAEENETSKGIQDEDSSPASPACRRSTRVKAPSDNAPPVRNTIALRRAKGNEFVFLQRTEAQQLALATKRNTRNNRGNSLMPRAALEAMAQQKIDESPATDDDHQRRADRKATRSRRPEASHKHVSWREDRLVEYEDEQPASEKQEEEGGTNSPDDVGGTSRSRSGTRRSENKAASGTRSSRSQVQPNASQDADSAESEGGPIATTTAPASATPRSRRVRRLGDSTMTSGTPVKTGSGRISKAPVVPPPAAMAVAGPATPTKARRKLIPKSPSSSLLPAPTSKGTSTTDQPFVSGIPTRSISTTSVSEGTKRKAMMQSTAGSTPVPRRVQARP